MKIDINIILSAISKQLMTDSQTPTDLSPPPYAKEDPGEPAQPDETPETTTNQPVPTVIIQEKPDFPPPAYTEKPGIVVTETTEPREENTRLDSVVSPLLWLVVILSILMFSPCGYLAFAFTCFAFWSETGGNVQVARYLSSVARICAIAAFMMGVLILLTPQVTKWDRKPYCMFEGESYRLCL